MQVLLLELIIDWILGMRWMLGLFEAGLFPGVNYYLSWYAFFHMLATFQTNG